MHFFLFAFHLGCMFFLHYSKTTSRDLQAWLPPKMEPNLPSVSRKRAALKLYKRHTIKQKSEIASNWHETFQYVCQTNNLLFTAEPRPVHAWHRYPLVLNHVTSTGHRARVHLGWWSQAQIMQLCLAMVPLCPHQEVGSMFNHHDT